jgi:DNA-binding NtrC family response regulator
LTQSDLIGPDDLDTTGDQAQLPRSAAADTDLPSAVAQLEETMIRRALEASGGNRTEAARPLSIDRQLLYAKMQRYGLGGEASANPTNDVGKDDA